MQRYFLFLLVTSHPSSIPIHLFVTWFNPRQEAAATTAANCLPSTNLCNVTSGGGGGLRSRNNGNGTRKDENKAAAAATAATSMLDDAGVVEVVSTLCVHVTTNGLESVAMVKAPCFQLFSPSSWFHCILLTPYLSATICQPPLLCCCIRCKSQCTIGV